MGALAAAWAWLPAGIRRALVSGLVLAVVASAAFGAGYLKADNRARHNVEVADLKARLAVVTRDLETARVMAEAARERAVDLEASDNSNREKVNALVADLATRPAPRACIATDDDARRLRAIR